MISKSPNLLNSIFVMPCEMQHVFTYHNQHQLRHVSLTIIISVSNDHIKYENVWTNNAMQ